MLHDEWPHKVIILQKVKGEHNRIGGTKPTWKPFKIISALVDTPTSRERFTAMQLENPIDRSMFLPFRTDITADMRCLYDGVNYELTGKPEDQGGQKEVLKVGLREVRRGELDG